MDMKTYLKQASQEERESLAVKVDSSVGYFYLIGGGHRNAGKDLCKALVAAEPKLTLHELRPDIWSPEMTAGGATALHRATDPEPPPGRAGRRPVSRDNIMTVTEQMPPRDEAGKK
jgi:hypothetical protein